MSDPDSLDYLQPDFDPSTVTVPRLRSILVTHSVPYPATAKKSQLIDIFNETVVPRAKKLLSQRERAKRSSRGIVDAESSQSSRTDDWDDEHHHQQTMAPPPPSTTNSRRSRSPRKSSRAVKQESEEPAPLSPTKKRPARSARSASRQAPSDTDTDGDATAAAAAGSRASTVGHGRRTVTPQVKLEPPAEVDGGLSLFRPSTSSRPTTAESDSIFTSDNPFQSGSSPLQPPKTPSGSSSRRKTTGGSESALAGGTAKSATRRRTDGPLYDDQAGGGGGGGGRTVSRSFEIPISSLKRRAKTPEVAAAEVEVEPGEEFTPEEQLELQQEEALRGADAFRRGQQQVAQRRKGGGSGLNLATPLWVLLVTLLGAYAAWYRQEKIKVGYCGLGRPATEFLPPELRTQLPDWANVLVEPQCEPCPAHAYCHDDFSVRCEDDYILKPHPLSLAGLVPLPPTCEPDGEKVRRVKAVADKAVEELRERRAKFECGEEVPVAGSSDGETAKLDTPAIEEEVLKSIISEKRSKRMGKQEFDDLWTAALGEIKDRDEVEVEVQEDIVQAANTGAVPNTYLSSTSLARVPLACALRRSVRLGLARYRLRISAVILGLLGLMYARSRYRSHVATTRRVPALVDHVLERLAAQKELAYDSGSGGAGDGADPFLFLPNLRDDVLRATHSLAERERVWKKVRAVVEQNSNVRQGQREGRDGEVGRAWEWIGPVAGAGDGAIVGSSSGSGGARARRGRVSWGPGVKSEDDASPAPAGREMAENSSSSSKAGLHQRWQEGGGRPVF